MILLAQQGMNITNGCFFFCSFLVFFCVCGDIDVNLTRAFQILNISHKTTHSFVHVYIYCCSCVS